MKLTHESKCSRERLRASRSEGRKKRETENESEREEINRVPTKIRTHSVCATRTRKINCYIEQCFYSHIKQSEFSSFVNRDRGELFGLIYDSCVVLMNYLVGTNTMGGYVQAIDTRTFHC
jgi:hypothetical protein